MTTFSLIPKTLPPRITIDHHQKIPRIIWQTMKTNYVPEIMGKFVNTWIEHNPEYQYNLYDDDDIIKFLESEYPEFLVGYNKIKHGASKADLWRYLIIHKYGGVYVDMDCKCQVPLNEWVSPDAEYVTQLGINKDICQWMILSVPNNPIFLKAAEKSLNNINTNNTYSEYCGFELNNKKLAIRKQGPSIKVSDRILSIAGPPVLQKAAEECFTDGSINGILKHTQIICTSNKVSCQMDGKVIHDCGNVHYKRALRLLKTPHYRERNFFSKVIMKLNL